MDRLRCGAACLWLLAGCPKEDEPPPREPVAVEPVREDRPREDPPPNEPAPEEPTPEEPTPEESTPEEPAIPVVEAGPCEAAEPVVLGESPVRRPSVALLHDARGGMAAYSTSEGTIDLVPLAADGTPRAHVSLETPAAMDLHSLHAAGDHIVLVAHGLCPDRVRLEKCIYVRAFARDGTGAGPELQHRTNEWASMFVRAAADSVVVLRSHTYLPPVLERYRVGAGRTIAREELAVLNHGVVPHDREPAQGVALAVDGDRIASIVVLDDEHREMVPRLHLDVAGASAVIRGLTREQIRGFVFDGDALRVFVARRGGVQTATLALDGALGSFEPSEQPRASVTASVHREGGNPRVALERVDARGVRVGDLVPLGTPRAASVAGSGDRFFALTAEGASPFRIELRSITCR